MPEERGLYPKMGLVEPLTYIARLHGYDKQGATGRAEALVERLGLAPRVVRRMARRESGSAVEARRAERMQRVG